MPEEILQELEVTEGRERRNDTPFHIGYTKVAVAPSWLRDTSRISFLADRCIDLLYHPTSVPSDQKTRFSDI